MILILSYRRKSWVHHSTLDPVQNLIYFSGPKNDQKKIHYCWIQKKWHIVDPSGPLNYTSTKNCPVFLHAATYVVILNCNYLGKLFSNVWHKDSNNATFQINRQKIKWIFNHPVDRLQNMKFEWLPTKMIIKRHVCMSFYTLTLA